MKARVVSETANLAAQGRSGSRRRSQAGVVFIDWGIRIGRADHRCLPLFILSPQFVQIAASRIVHPVRRQGLAEARTDRSRRQYCRTRVPVGQRVDVRMKLVRGDKASMKAIVYYQYDDGPVDAGDHDRAATDGTYGCIARRARRSGKLAGRQSEDLDASRRR